MSALVCLTYDDALPVHREVVASLLSERGGNCPVCSR